MPIRTEVFDLWDNSYDLNLYTYPGRDVSKTHGGWCTDTFGRMLTGFVKCATIKADLTTLMATIPTETHFLTGAPYKDL